MRRLRRLPDNPFILLWLDPPLWAFYFDTCNLIWNIFNQYLDMKYKQYHVFVMLSYNIKYYVKLIGFISTGCLISNIIKSALSVLCLNIEIRVIIINLMKFYLCKFINKTLSFNNFYFLVLNRAIYFNKALEIKS